MKTRHAFTLFELLVVIGIMGLLGSIATGGYRAMVRGMEERGVMVNVNAFVRAAYQRAQIDRQPTIVYFWNETLRSKTDDDLEVVVGKAVAVRRSGRISRRDGNVLVDEFADLNFTYMTNDERDDASGATSSGNALMELYPMDNLTQGGLQRSLVEAQVVSIPESVQFLGGLKTDDADGDVSIPAYGFRLKSGFSSWKQGMAYGFEFLRLELPNGYIFGRSHSEDAGNAVVFADKFVFNVGLNDNSGRNSGGTTGNATIEVNVLRQKGASLSPEKIGVSDSPDRNL